MAYKLYDGGVELLFDEGAHLYTVDGEIVESITGILRVISKPALVPWAVKLACDHMTAEWTAGRVYDEFEIDTIIKAAKMAHRYRAEDAATIGTMVHAWIERHLKGQTPAMPVNTQMRNGVEAFLRFQKEHKLEVIESERKVFSRSHNVAGTCDIYGLYEGVPVVADIKTSSGIYPEALLQAGGYDLCLSEEIGTTFAKHLIINCKKDGKLDFHVSDNVESNREGFLAALKLHRALETIKQEQKDAKPKRVKAVK